MPERESVKLSAECEVAHYTSAYILSSNRVRYVIITITVASILMFVGYRNSDQEGWMNSRVRLAQVAQQAVVWQTDAENLKGLEKAAKRWIEAKGYTQVEEVKEYAAEMTKSHSENVLLVRIPFLGISFDINDLGLFGTIALVVLMLMLTFAMSRQHENLFLSLWKVRQICKKEGSQADGDSKANLVYHALAMAQQFSKPPTLARWNEKKWVSFSKVLILLPAIVQGLIFWHDWNTREFGFMISPKWAAISLTTQALGGLLILVLTVVCYLYTASNSRRWAYTFFYVNPHLQNRQPPSWWSWVGLKREPPPKSEKEKQTSAGETSA